MTVFLRALYGPFGPFEERPGRIVVNPPHGYVAQVDWHFFGIRENNSVGRWAIRFEPPKRVWKCIPMPVDETVRVGKSWTKAEIDPAFADAFVPDKPMVYGRTYLDILKARLSKDDIAFASRLAIEAAGR